jgi:hypothetical protein
MFEYSKQAEQALANLIGIPCELAPGKFSAYDFTDPLTDTTYEVKFQFKPSINIEFQQSKNTNPSGIATSTADYWLMVNTGWSKAHGLVGKVRKFAIADLKLAVETHQLGGLDHGKYCVFDDRALPHEWLGDISIDDKLRMWDLTKWLACRAAKTSFKRKPSRNPFPNRVDNIPN